MDKERPKKTEGTKPVYALDVAPQEQITKPITPEETQYQEEEKKRKDSERRIQAALKIHTQGKIFQENILQWLPELKNLKGPILIVGPNYACLEFNFPTTEPVLGLEMSEEAVILARTKATTEGYTNIKYWNKEFKRDGSDLPTTIDGQPIQTVFSEFVVEHAPDTFQKLWENLPEGGIMVATTVVGLGNMIRKHDDQAVLNASLEAGEVIERISSEFGGVNLHMHEDISKYLDGSNWQYRVEERNYPMSRKTEKQSKMLDIIFGRLTELVGAAKVYAARLRNEPEKKQIDPEKFEINMKIMKKAAEEVTEKEQEPVMAAEMRTIVAIKLKKQHETIEKLK